jgi:hypothetical protein
MPGQAGILEDINRTYIHSINELPYSSGTPEKNIQISGHISGWVDIVGFRQMIRDKGIDYVPGSPADYAIVQYDSWANLDCEGCSLDSLTKRISVSVSGNRTLAALSVVLKYSRTVCSGGEDGSVSCSTSYYSESATFLDSEESPSLFIFPTKQAITIEQYRGFFPTPIKAQDS